MRVQSVASEQSSVGLLTRFSRAGGRSSDERPFLKLCEKCRGKGQLSYFDNHQRKTYGPCTDCSKGEENSRWSLGVKLKCTCQKESSNYAWMHASQAHGMKHPPAEIKALLALQADLRNAGTALLLNCPCGAKYLCIDGPERRKISGDPSYQAADKACNREIAETLIRNGIHKVLQQGTEMRL